MAAKMKYNPYSMKEKCDYYIQRQAEKGGERRLKASIYDIAREAGVSIATVSRVLNHKNVVAPQTRARVEETIQRLNYHPSTIARGLVSKRTPTVGILTTSVCSPHHARTAYTIERELFKLGYSSILCNTGGSLSSNVEYLHMLVDKGVSGIMCLGAVFGNIFEETSVLTEFSHIPFIFGNCNLTAENAYTVAVDEFHSMQMCVEYLMARGHREIFHIRDMTAYGAAERAKNFILAMRLAGLPADDDCVFHGGHSIEGGYAGVEKLLQSGRTASAILFDDDLTAVGGLKRLKQAGLSVPGDVAVIGCNNNIVSQCCEPMLTTVDNKSDIIGGLMVKLLEMILGGQNTSHLLTVTPELVVREST